MINFKNFSPSSVNYTGPLTRTSTMDSRELEMAVRQSYLIVPSYSEAVLLEPVNNGPVSFICNLRKGLYFSKIFGNEKLSIFFIKKDLLNQD